MEDTQYLVAVVGAGPAGLFGARELARQGAQVVLFNRDIKPGGLAEYGIHPHKHFMKESLRNQFRQILDLPGITYYGNLTVGQYGDLTLDDLRKLGFQAILVTTGAQGIKRLDLPGEDLDGVYLAKDVVFHYNKLPPYSEKPFHFCKKCAIVGAGNVMIDIARFLIREVQVDEVVAIVRRGPAEVKFDKSEMAGIIANLDLKALDAEIERVSPRMLAVGQDPQAAKDMILESLPTAEPKESDTLFRFEFMTSTANIIGSKDDTCLTQLEVDDNILVMIDNGEVKSQKSGKLRCLDLDNVIFAIGDKVDDGFGLPVEWDEYIRNPDPCYPIKDISYEAYDPVTKSPIKDVFMGGWARQASFGMVGYARKDGTNASKAVWQYLQTLSPIQADLAEIKFKVFNLGKPIITKENIKHLEEAEKQEALKLGEKEFKFASNSEMLKIIRLEGTLVRN
ncbi:MAG: FAD-dependent oxidoreductase [Anaerolineales bacterium]|nr:FAD-dependent oxidoreductase [Anaerolineales bacterium]